VDSNAAAEPTCKQPATAYQAFKAIFHGGRSRPDSSKIRDLAIIVLNIDLKKRISLLLRLPSSGIVLLSSLLTVP
jgi:hypothetical protein